MNVQNKPPVGTVKGTRKRAGRIWGTTSAVLLATGVFAVALPVFLICSNVRLVINSPLLYEYDFARYGIESRTGLPKEEFRRATDQIVDYFNGSDEWLDVRVQGEGKDVSLYKEREVLHMRDVKGLVRGVYAAGLWTAGYVVLVAAVGALLARRRFLPVLASGVKWSAIGAVAVIVLVGIASLVAFDPIFTAFHKLSFSNDLWLLDPDTDYLLKMFPEGFFLDATPAIAVFTVAEFAVLAGAIALLRRRFR